ncbi:type II toxin-antitoxin system Phd/YefM family antitoxin [Enterobacter ludwigii]|uniref:type II toxin-antitoxin system Phd/YefM family antitoxin n=1 Tax=Enterobacter ludwigii TaxID=299767 RepID=UPI00129D134A|nr:type II toxin-antitoxin system prevent-host-death family antitoxin [Enterobacter ludwigii]MRI49753.1 type II toxin-antitoxin system prevent-host-death family antitoxin [Enterobacter ludwigii]HDR2843243.1 type II toxin-antitoxin system prevent-host-death family antitoxin [Enterobacter sichuanensis]
MRKVSYTQMRAELSDILDAIRNGETVVVTQRGRPDTVLKGSTSSELSYSPITTRPYTTRLNPSNTIIEVVRDAHGQAYYVKKAPNGEIITKVKADNTKISFSDALKLTQTKHAKIIKALEDK